MKIFFEYLESQEKLAKLFTLEIIDIKEYHYHTLHQMSLKIFIRV